jgi:hypothetical protein
MTARYGDDKLDREGTQMNAKETTDEYGLTWVRFNLSSVICHLSSPPLFSYSCQSQETLHARYSAVAKEPSLIGEFE